jgi:hypothetical protein
MLAKKDYIAVLPTGYGKSLPYQIFLPVVRELQKCETDIARGQDYCMLSVGGINARPSPATSMYSRFTCGLQRYSSYIL